MPCDNNSEVEDYTLNVVDQIATISTIPGSSFCVGAAISVPFTVSYPFNSGNIFTAQLSNAAGDFGSPVNIGSLTQTNSGTISATIPIGAQSGTGYRIRIISSNPVKIGADNGSNLAVDVLPTANAGSALSAICKGGTSVALGGSVGGSATGGTWSTPAGGTFTPGATALNATWTPPAAYTGTATLTLTTTGGACTAVAASKTQQVDVLPTANAGSALSAICKGGTSAALGGSVGGSATGGTWSDNGVGGTFNPNATTLNATWTPPAAYTGTATLILTTSGGSCVATASKTQQVVVLPTADVGSVLSAICKGGTSVALGGSVGGSATGGTWSTPAGGTFTPGATALNATWTPPSTYSGTATLTLTSSGGACTVASASKTQQVDALPTANAGSALSAICKGGTSVALGGSVGGSATGGTWSDNGVGGTFNPDAMTLNATWTSPITYTGTATLTLTTTGSACTPATASKTQQVVVTSTANAGSALSTICKGGTSAALGGSVGGSATGGIWSDNGVGGTFNPNATTLNATWTPPAAYTGTATLTLTTTGGSCVATASKTQVVDVLPTAYGGPALSAICQGETSVALGGLVGGSATGGTWSTPAGGSFSPGATALNATWTPPAAYSGTATLTLTTTGGVCAAATASNTQLVNPLPIANYTFTATPSTINYGSTSVLSLSGSQSGTNYQLRDDTNANVGSPVTGTGSSISFAAVGPDATTTYNVFATNTTTGCSVQLTNTATITVLAGCITSQPSNSRVCAGGTTTFSITAPAKKNLFQWQVLIPDLSGTSTWTNLANGGIYSGVTSATLTLTNVTATYNGYQYRCIVSNGCSATSDEATLNVGLMINYSLTANPGLINSGQSSTLTLSGSQTGVSYQLRTGTTNIGSPVTGTGSAITFTSGNLTSSTNFNVLATGCATIQITDTRSVIVNETGIIIDLTTCNGQPGLNFFTNSNFGTTTTNNYQIPNQSLFPGVTLGAPLGAYTSYVYGFNSSNAIPDGNYVIANSTAGMYRTPQQVMSRDVWLYTQDRSSTPGSGQMYIVNADTNPGVFYTEALNNLCENTRYEFSAEMINLYAANWVPNGPNYLNYFPTDDQGNRYTLLPNIDFMLDGKVALNTGNIMNDGSWKTYGFTFRTAPGQTSVVLTMRNNSVGGMGNDLALDNIIMRSCGPVIDIKVETTLPVCPGLPVTMSAKLLASDYLTPEYQWQKSMDNGVTWTNISGANGSSYTNNNPAQGDQFRFVVGETLANLSNPNCSVASDPVIILTTAGITATTPGSVCGTGTVTLGATATSGSTIYWYANLTGGSSIGTGPVYTTPAISTTTTYYVEATNGGCTSSPRTPVVATVNSDATVSVSISASTGNSICSGTSVTFTATATNGGATPTYQWKLGSTTVGTNSSTYTTSTLTNGNVITCVMTSSISGCIIGSPATSNSITMVVGSSMPASVTISADPGNTSCAGTNVSFSATPTNGGATPTYQWTKNGTDIFGAVSNIYSTSSLAQGDIIRCIMTTSLSCATGSPATSNGITMTVNALPPAPTAGNVTATYDGFSHTGTATASGSNIVWYDASSGGNITVAPSGTNFGTYSAWAESVNSTTGCRSAARTHVMVTINQATLTVTAINQMKCYGQIFNFTGTEFTSSGLKNSDAISTVTLTSSGSGAAAAAGNYSIIPSAASGTGLGNYAITYNNGSLTITALPSATISYAGTPFCSNFGIGTVTRTGTAGGAYSAPAGLAIDSGTGAITTSTSTPGNYTITYTMPAGGGCGIVTTTCPVAIKLDGSWNGSASGDWNTTSNWECNQLPTLTSDVIIANGLSNYPTLSSGSTGKSKDLSIQSSSSVTVSNNTLEIAGTITNNGAFTATAGTIEMKGATAQTIPANAFATNTIKNLTINNSAGVTLQGALNVTGIVKAATGDLTSGGNLTLVSSSSTQTALIDGSGTGQVLGSVTMQRYLPSAFGYKYFSSPFQAATVSDFSAYVNLSATFPPFYKYDEDNHRDSLGVNVYQSGWVKYLSGTLAPMTGYSANFGAETAAKTVSISGTVSNGSMSVPLSNHNRKYTKGFNLVGNPYPSPIDWKAVSGWTKTNIDDAIYFFNAGNTNQYTGVYSSYVNGVSSDGGVTNSLIASMQGFFVHVSDPVSPDPYPVTGTLGFTNSIRTNDLNLLFKDAIFDNRIILRFTANFETKNAIEDAAVIYLDEISTPRFDKDLDALKITNTDLLIPNLYTLSSDLQQLSINGLPALADSVTKISLGVLTLSDGWIDLAAKDIERLPSTTQIYLVDAEKGVTQNLKQSPKYRVYLKAGEYDQRFTLIFSLSAIDQTATTPDVKLFSTGRSANLLLVKLNLPLNSKGRLIVTNMAGQQLLLKEVTGMETVEIDPNAGSGVYVITVLSGQSVQSEKILIRKDYE